MIARVFPRKTNATPDDDMVFFTPPDWFTPEVDEVHVSVAFTYDIPKAEQLAENWMTLGVPVKMGGPAYNEPGGDFIPGMYLKRGYVITSRGCPNRCWFCQVPKREGYQLRELPITEGYNILDDNLLACSDKHINTVFDMLSYQKHPPLFTGGLEAKILKKWHCERIQALRPERMYFAYDTPDDYEPLVDAGKMLRKAGITAKSHIVGCYVLIGYRGDTFDKALKRLTDTAKAGFVPYAMLYRDQNGNTDKTWNRFQREWCDPVLSGKKFNQIWKEKKPCAT